MIGATIRNLRKEKGMTLTELAKAVGVSQPFLSQIERGTKTVSIPLGVEIANVLGCTIEDLAKECN